MKQIKDLVAKPTSKDTKSGDLLSDILTADSFVGWVYSINYERALILSNDSWKTQVGGIPQNCFLIAYATSESAKKPEQVYLLRVLSAARLPQHDDLAKSKIDFYQQQSDFSKEKRIDPITLNQLQFGALECRVLGTFYEFEGRLMLGTDINDFPAASRLKVFKPKGRSLDLIVNFMDPFRIQKSLDDAKALGIDLKSSRFKLGEIRYTSSNKVQAPNPTSVYMHAEDLIARRTAVLGMTRTGKSNMIKQLISVVQRTAHNSGVCIGQIIFDVNGEYANANHQDQGSLAEAFRENTLRYRLVETPGFLPLQTNFYVQLNDGIALLQDLLMTVSSPSGDIKLLQTTSFDFPDAAEHNAKRLFFIRKAAYWGLLHLAGFRNNGKLTTTFKVSAEINSSVQNFMDNVCDPADGLTPEECKDWFLALRSAYKAEQRAISQNQKSKNPSAKLKTPITKWMASQADVNAIINLMACESDNGTVIRGYKILRDFSAYHSPDRTEEVGKEIYDALSDGKIVILDLSIGRPTLRNFLAQRIIDSIFNKSVDRFIKGKTPPNIMIYIEEAHVLIGKDSKPDDTWPRLAKEGAKYKLGLVFATQEVSSINSNILANTENWFITHLNNQREIAELSRFYDFADFADGLLRSQDVGFARVKMLSGSFVLPVQIDKFEPKEK